MSRAISFVEFRGWLADGLAVEPGECIPAASLVGDLGADSLDLIELVITLEEEIGHDISDEILESVQTVEDAWNLYLRVTA